MPQDPFNPTPDPDPEPIPNSHPDHIPFLYGTDPLNPIFTPPVLIEDLNADPEPPSATPDPIPDPDPPSPSLPSPDPGVFHPGTDPGTNLGTGKPLL